MAFLFQIVGGLAGVALGVAILLICWRVQDGKWLFSKEG